VTADVDLYEELTALTRRGWRSQFQVDELGQWWLVEDGRRRKHSWKPADEADMLVGVALLHMLNDSTFSVPEEYAERVGQRYAPVLRRRLMFAAMCLYRHIRY